MSIGVENAVKTIRSSVEQAIASCPQLQGRRIQDTNFRQVWIALAGYDREAISKPVDKAIEQLFERSVGATLTISTDVNLLAIIAGNQEKADDVTALIAGTGSIAMKFVRKADEFVRTARTGGWGPLLGDGGSGFDIGRRALRHTLAEIDKRSASEADRVRTVCSLSHLSQKVIRHLVPDQNAGSMADLLTAVMSSTSGQGQSEHGSKQRIASIAPLVIEASIEDLEAEKIVEESISNLIGIMQPLTRTMVRDASTSVLVLAGGLMKSKTFRERLQRSTSDMPFTCIVVVHDPAHAGAEHLSRMTETSL